MKHIKLLALCLVSIFILSATLPSVAAEQSDDLNIIERILLRWFRLRQGMFGSPYFVLRFVEPEIFTANPNTIDIEFLTQTEITIGIMDNDTTSYKSLQDEDYMPNSLMVGHDFEFSLELPDYIPKDAFVAHFNPQQLVGGEEGLIKSNLILYSNIPKNIALPRNIQLRINISKYTTFGNLYLPAKGIARIPGIGLLVGSMPIMWFLAATGITNPANPFGRLLSGKRFYEYSAYVDIVVKLDRFHLADITPLKRIEVGPDQLTSIPIEIRNRGSHVDSFNFRVSSSSGSELMVTPPPAITLGPNEVGYTSVGIVSPRSFLDPGTAHSINIEAYSIYDPETTFNNTATVITRGVYVSEINAAYAAFIIVILLIIVAFILYRRKKILEKTCKKPEKPWNILVERKYLEELKKKDNEAYEKERLMMEDEYKSAMLWYKDYQETMKKERDQKSKEEKKKPINKQKDKTENGFSKFFSKSEKKEKTVKKEKKPVKKVEKPKKEKEEKVQETPDIVKEQDKDIQKKSEEMQRRKEKALLRIKRAQEKQKIKIKK